MLAENIKNARRKLGLTQEELASKVGVARASLSSWEIGRASPDMETFVRLCGVLGLGADDLLGIVRKEDYTAMRQPVLDLAEQIARLSPAEFSIIRKLVLSIVNEKDLVGDKKKAKKK